jgi:hypothetical protein
MKALTLVVALLLVGPIFATRAEAQEMEPGPTEEAPTPDDAAVASPGPCEDSCEREYDRHMKYCDTLPPAPRRRCQSDAFKLMTDCMHDCP